MRIVFVAMRLRRWLALSCVVTVVGILTVIAVGRSADHPHYLLNWLIAVDAGHGGHDKGAWFPKDDLVEKDVNLDVARMLSKLLVSDGADVILIRTDDTFVHLHDRAHKANNAQARMFVSLHVNRYPGDRSCSGAQVFYAAKSTQSQALAVLVQEQLLGMDPGNCRQALPGDYKVLRDAVMPAILVEIGFATNARDRALIMSSHYRRNVVYAIRNGIVAYVRKTEGALPPADKAKTGER